MGKQAITDSIGPSIRDSSLSQAFGVMADLARGNTVSAEALDQAKHALLDSLASQPVTDTAISQQGLVTLFAASPNAADRAELIGNLVAVGAKAAPVLDVILRLNLPTGLTTQEIDFIKEHLQMSPKELLQAFSHWLEEAQKAGAQSSAPRQRQGTGDKDYPLSNDDRKGVLPKKESDDEEEKNEQPDPALGPPELEKQIRDPTLGQQERIHASLELGESAIRPLVNLLHSDNPDEQRFASLALYELGGRSETARAVYEAMRHLESTREFRDLAREIRRYIEDQATDSGSGGRQRPYNSPVVDGWLRNAIDRCDAPGIMRAAAGRETLALSLVTRRLCELRIEPTP